MIPCEECLKFPICKPKMKLNCVDLYKCIANLQRLDCGVYEFDHYNENLPLVEKLFEKYVSATGIVGASITFTVIKWDSLMKTADKSIVRTSGYKVGGMYDC